MTAERAARRVGTQEAWEGMPWQPRLATRQGWSRASGMLTLSISDGYGPSEDLDFLPFVKAKGEIFTSP